jgi:hypothetical protein
MEGVLFLAQVVRGKSLTPLQPTQKDFLEKGQFSNHGKEDPTGSFSSMVTFPKEAIPTSTLGKLTHSGRSGVAGKRYSLCSHLALGSFTIHTAVKTSRICPKPIL